MGLIDKALAGDQRALARLASQIEREHPATLDAVAALPRPPRASHVVGLTGPPGVGKSSLIHRLIEHGVERGEQMAALLVDPTSPVTGGAVLGDRIRLGDGMIDGIFVRSLASRGWSGGLAPSVALLIQLLESAGFSMVLIETVGVGQDAVDLRQLADTTVVVQMPNAGDTVQSLKAGVLEIASIYAVNKADLPGAAATVRELNSSLQLAPLPAEAWAPPVVAVSSRDKTRLGDLWTALELHRDWAQAHHAVHRRADRLAWHLEKVLVHRIVSRLRSPDATEVARRLSEGEITLTQALTETERFLASPLRTGEL